MHILVLQETDWLNRGPHTQHHIFERLSKKESIKITVLDYDMDQMMEQNSIIIKKTEYTNISKVIEDPKIHIIRTGHIQVKYLRRISSLITNFFTIIKIIRKERPDFIVSFSLSNGLIGLFLSKIFRIPFIFFYIDILHELVPIDYIRGAAKSLSKILFKYSDKILVHTYYQKNMILQSNISPNKISILPDGIALENIRVNQEKLNTLKKQLSLNEKDFVIFFMGYLYEFAGLIEIINYYHSKVKSENLNLKFIILGDGGIYNKLIQLKNKLEADWVILPGRVPFSYITEYIELADLCLMSFKINDITKDIVPIKIFEYMAQKKPVLSNSLPAVVHELKEESDIIFTENQEILIEKIGILMKQRHKLKEIGQKGYKLVKEKYAWNKLIAEFKQHIINIIKMREEK
ncbi:MAG: hypothetical protein BAJALOKI1v1_500016 [Promethearchaeota archaeon]|nr:MAG: hypothetical protein BAJALOKI1v1_500016 [Candidatus Lokiarchaeota archaeon]